MVVDLLLDPTGDLLVVDGDIVFGEATNQNIKMVVLSEKGSFKERPDIGVGIRGYLNDEKGNNLAKVVTDELGKDGADVLFVDFNEDGKMQIEASYD